MAPNHPKYAYVPRVKASASVNEMMPRGYANEVMLFVADGLRLPTKSTVGIIGANYRDISSV